MRKREKVQLNHQSDDSPLLSRRILSVLLTFTSLILLACGGMRCAGDGDSRQNYDTRYVNFTLQDRIKFKSDGFVRAEDCRLGEASCISKFNLESPIFEMQSETNALIFASPNLKMAKDKLNFVTGLQFASGGYSIAVQSMALSTTGATGGEAALILNAPNNLYRCWFVAAGTNPKATDRAVPLNSTAPPSEPVGPGLGDSFDLVITKNDSLTPLARHTVRPPNPGIPSRYLVEVKSTGTDTFSFRPIYAVCGPKIVAPALPAAATGAPFDAPLAAGGGFVSETVSPKSLVWSVSSGALPSGVRLVVDPTDTGSRNKMRLSGTPVAAGTYTFGIRVTDQAKQTDNKVFTMTVGGALPSPRTWFISGVGPALTTPFSASFGPVTLGPTTTTTPFQNISVGTHQVKLTNSTGTAVDISNFDVTANTDVTLVSGGSTTAYNRIFAYPRPRGETPAAGSGILNIVNARPSDALASAIYITTPGAPISGAPLTSLTYGQHHWGGYGIDVDVVLVTNNLRGTRAGEEFRYPIRAPFTKAVAWLVIGEGNHRLVARP